MGNHFGHYHTFDGAEADILKRGFTKRGDRYIKPSVNMYGDNVLAIVEITEGYVSAEYTGSGKRETYYEHHYIA